jgi:predicted AAA+ superfamily ATPase
MKLINREIYLKKLRLYKDKQLIKILTGARRVGKSTILEMFKSELLDEHVDPGQVTFINFEDYANQPLTDPDALYTAVESRLISEKMNYIFLDEIQNVRDFERVVDSLFIKKNVDLYLTGSNSNFLSSDLATLLTGRYLELKILPLSFAEYASAFDNGEKKSTEEHFANYLTYGALPQTVDLFLTEPGSVYPYLQSIYDTVVFKDIVARYRVKNSAMLEDILRYVFDNIGNITNPKRISDYMTSSNRKISNHSVDSYLAYLTGSFLIYPVSRFDLRGKRLLSSSKKYYALDTGLRQMLLAHAGDYGRLLENVVFLELLRRGNQIYAGEKNGREIDFIVKSPTGDVTYYQVAASVRDPNTLARELGALASISDHNSKYLLTMDNEELSHNGIKQRNILGFLKQ